MPARATLALLALAAAAAVVPEAASAAKLGGTVWTDADRDGRADRGEARLSGLRVTVQRAASARKPFRTTARRTTGRRGTWSLTVRRAGRYRARVRLADGQVITTGAKVVRRRSGPIRFDVGVLLPPAVPAPAAVVPPAVVAPPADVTPAPQPDPTTTPEPERPARTVGDLVWTDDGDGVREPGEPGRPSVLVELWTADRATRLAATATDESGAWVLTAPTADAVRVRLVVPDGTRSTTTAAGPDRSADSDIAASGPDAGFTAPLVVDGPRTDVDAGVVPGGAMPISGTVWEDADLDGLRDTGETRPRFLSRVELFNDNLTQRLGTAVLDADGRYALVGVLGGAHRVRVGEGGTSYLFARRDAGDDTRDSDVGEDGVSATITSTSSTLNAGVNFAISIGDRVWRDADADGVQDAGEPGVEGVTLQLWNPAKTRLHTQVTSRADGRYTLPAPGPRDYRIRVLRPAGFAGFSPLDATDDLTDSDIHPDGVDAGFTDAFTIDPSVISTTRWDAGLRP